MEAFHGASARLGAAGVSLTFVNVKTGQRSAVKVAADFCE